ncbi:protein phosphatase 1 regulatory subunit 32 isoform X1 [Leopardus geoffroyi]|uniref:protein phosphatase 1 regulatory subunit 32 isoform X1 n=1 Tax=Leopardus geoffroyi TaxID=46844 RepID=UPI001E26578E|nr:protein phosphatase 1 regulatory subunit 32 isoform X1 [Leopardus geoffroyi]XP_045343163.1 protein phosphatase 1 regulatory subunit 32 isoform X1 [Leopardus geoffroyi]XP_045343164.1 protein phosphatase 1 regulatory subunit 32 isoform X1 [Leopardus geoffroyi]
MMGKVPLGVVSPYVKMSSGGCTDPLKFYATTYSTAYGQEEFRPRMGSHEGTGYKSNYRPVVSYQANLEALDNPAMGHGPYNPFSPPAPLSLSSQGHRSSSDPLEQVRPNFQSVTSQSYRPLEVPDGTYPLPWNMHQTSSGYSREKPSAATPTKEVRKVHFDTQDYGPQAIIGLEPRDMPLLHQQQGKGSLEWENSRHGPRFMTSEYNSKYLKETSNQPDLLQKISTGSKEETGFTEESTKNPIGFQPPSQTVPGDPVLHPGRSVTRSDFLPMTHIRGDEFLPVLARGSERETGYSRVNERLLNPRVPPPSPRPSSVSHGQFQPPQRVQQTNVALLGRETVGNKEPTGFSLNNPSYIRSPYDPDMDNQYLTTYNQGYFKNIPKGLDREGWTRGGIQPQKPGGYVLNQPVTRMEATPTPTESLRRLHPHVGRTLITEDPFYRTVPPSSHFATSS